MKRFLCLILTFIMLASVLSGCVFVSNKNTARAENTAITEGAIKSLLKENYNCNVNIFLANNLPFVGEPIKDNIYQVDPEKFESYTDFKNYLLGIYTSEYVEDLLAFATCPYVNLNGKLCINVDLSAAKGYYVDWSDPKVEITSQDKTSCEFKVTLTAEEPGDPPVISETVVLGTATLENGNWLLNKILY